MNVKRFGAVVFAVAALGLAVGCGGGGGKETTLGLKEGDKMVVSEELDRVKFEAYFGESIKQISNTDGGHIVIEAGTVLQVFATPKTNNAVIEFEPIKAGDVTDADSLMRMFVPERYRAEQLPQYYTFHIDTATVRTKLKKQE